MMCNMHKWITFDFSDGTSNKGASCGLLFCSYGALLCVQCVCGLESHEYLQGWGVVDENGGMVGSRKVPVYFGVIGRILLIIRPITPKYTARIDCPTQVWVYGIGFVFF